ncbi:hypothetical protein ONZ45_g10384 [Pleurotus djamor]|nr:hypothetical protein ONZ45_g10384 [Pleurotus djamor]
MTGAASYENGIASSDNHLASNDRKQSPPAFLDLADSRVELKRLEHERQRLLQRLIFEGQMRAWEAQQAQELLNIPHDASLNGNGLQYITVSAPTTPPRVNAVLNGDFSHGLRSSMYPLDADVVSQAVGTAFSDKRKSVTYVPTVNLSPDLATTTNGFSRNAGAKSMPAIFRTSASSHNEELASQLQGLALAGDRSNRASPVPGSPSASILSKGATRFMDDEGARYATTYNAGMMLDEQLDQEMQNAMRHLPTSDEDSFAVSFSQKEQHSQSSLLPLSRRGSPPSLPDSLTSTRSVPATPLGLPGAVPHILKTPRPPGIPDTGVLSAQFDGSNLSDSPNGSSLEESLAYRADSLYGLNNGSHAGPPGADRKMSGLTGPEHKRGDVDREFNRFAGTRLEDLQGEIATMCKDKHGCRFLQNKLEEGVPEHLDIIFRETFSHFAELMTDPFGNYLCQKLLEYSTDEQRSLICESVAQDLLNISLNMHGTRAVQMMIDFFSTKRQKCLNKLAPDVNQFIYDAVAQNCVEVATHRRGCCVLQRCIDYASEGQRVQLVNEITSNALTLVQDPYGNYVVQYILDLNDSHFSDAIIRKFAGNVCALSVQKFSSNVIEKCVRVAQHNSRKTLIEEFLNRSRLEQLLRDSYGNYCVQTALDYAEPAQRALLVEGIRPVLPLIRNTPCGKHIRNKLQRAPLDGPYGQHSLTMVETPGIGSCGAARPMPQTMHPSAELYATQNGFYQVPQNGAASYSPVHLTPQLHTLQAQGINGYVYFTGMPAAHLGGYSFAGVSPFDGVALAVPIADPYQRTSFGYGM